MTNLTCIDQNYTVNSDLSINFQSCNYEEPVSCFSLWELINPLPKLIQSLSDDRLRNDSFLLLRQGCLSRGSNLCNELILNKRLLLCCCDSYLCNQNLDPESCIKNFLNNPKVDNLTISNLTNIELSNIKSNDKIILICLSILFIVIPIIVFYSFYLIKLLLIKKQNQINYQEDLSDRLLNDHDKIEIIEYRTRGRYGNIYKARLIDKNSNVDPLIVAVKVFQKMDYESFNNELKIYRLPDFKHENILNFIKAELRTGNLLNISEYWLITKYQENGSLQDFLSDNLLNQKQIISISLDIACGLAFLHGYGKSNRQIAHRDFKSGNVLLDHQLKACIGDFGFGLVFYNHKLETDSLNQVGTCRYLSPELLDGAINFSGDSLLKVDIYACSLVYWEILSRNAELQEQNKIKQYKLPFEIELGIMPSIDEFRNYVSFEQKRPIIEMHWYESEFLKEFCRIIEDCWCVDAEKRLTAACIYERLKIFNNLTDCIQIDS